MKVIGIDPAPKKGTTIYDPDNNNNGGWSTIDACKLPDHVGKLSNSSNGILLCWDAPLTAGHIGTDGCYYERSIERFFSSKQAGWKVPEGISIRAYAGCPHWAVTRAAVGLPRVGKFDCENLPFTLCAKGGAPVTSNGNHIVEVHPAVAIWAWCRGEKNPPTAWEYKSKNKTGKVIRNRLWEEMKSQLHSLAPCRAPEDDDEFDAYVAYLLGKRWLDADGVVLLGNGDTGSFLMPHSEELQDDFDQFTKRSIESINRKGIN